MFSCPLHNWSSMLSPCPACHLPQTVTTTNAVMFPQPSSIPSVDWEICSFKNIDGSIDIIEGRPVNPKWYADEPDWFIYSVRRKSDNEVFTVGDETKDGVIKQFELRDKRIFVVTFKDGGFSFQGIEALNPSTTEEKKDRIEVYVHEMISASGGNHYGYSFNIPETNIDSGKIEKVIEGVVNGDKTYTQKEYDEAIESAWNKARKMATSYQGSGYFYPTFQSYKKHNHK